MRLSRRALVATLLLAAFAVSVTPRSLAQNRNGFDAPMNLLRGRPSVSVMVDGKGPYTFVIDTGAGAEARVSQHLADALGLPVVGEVEAHGLGGITHESLVGLSLELGPIAFKDIRAPVAADSVGGRTVPWDGILGFKLFANYLLTLDYVGNRIDVTNGSLANTPGTTAFSLRNDIPVIDGSLAGSPIDFDVDSGSSGGIGVPPALRAQLKFTKAPQVIGKACGSGGCVDLQVGTVAGALTLGSIAIANPEVMLLPLPTGAGNIGYEFLKDYRVTFDQQSKELLFARG